MGIALDELQEGDEEIEVDGIPFVIGEHESQSLKMYNGVRVEYHKTWLSGMFHVAPSWGGC